MVDRFHNMVVFFILEEAVLGLDCE